MTPRLITTNGDRYWAAEYRDTLGRRKYKGLGSKEKVTKREAAARLNDFAAKLVLIPGARDVNGRMTLEAWCGRYLAIRTDLSEGALQLTAGTVKRLKEHFGADTRMDRITPARAADFANWLRTLPSNRKDDDGKPIPFSAATVSKYIRDARAIFAKAVKERAIAENPFAGIELATVRASEDWQIITMAQLDRILDACPDHAHRCLFALCRLAGLRLGSRGGEALGLEWGDINWEQRSMLVWDQKRGRQRIVPIQDRLYTVLRDAFEAAPEGSTLVCDVLPNNLYRRAGRILKAAGLPVYEKPFHTLRKNLETEWLNEHPIPAVCKWLGNSPAVAMAHYHRADAEGAMAQVTGMRQECEKGDSETQEVSEKRV